MKFFDELVWRGLVKDISSPEIEEKINEGNLTFYWGTDPTADSLHLGHYSSLVTAKRLFKYGHHPILLVGGATGLIGDPRPTSERDLISKESLDKNLEGIRNQVSKIFDGQAQIVNNFDWTKDFSFLDFLRDVGKYINVNYMLNKDIIRRRLDSGITFAEFAYTLIQGNDFLHLFETYNCTLQVEGSDQWGNITTGIELIRKKTSKEAYGFTMPLILDKNGKKFGKSEGNALWLDKNKTSSYELYQYLINTDDEMVISYLKVFTFLTKEEIEAIENKHMASPELRIAQKALAKEIITDLHGSFEYEKALKISEALFSTEIMSLSLEDVLNNMKDVANVSLQKDENIIEMLVRTEICSSKREAREMITAGAITFNNLKMMEQDANVSDDIAIEGKLIVIKKGKKNCYLGNF